MVKFKLVYIKNVYLILLKLYFSERKHEFSSIIFVYFLFSRLCGYTKQGSIG